jgi:hypothetical protein
MSPTTAIVTTNSPPPPSPWTARKTISSNMLSLIPHSAEPTRKITIADWSTTFRPYRSPSFPYKGQLTVAASR